MTTMTMTTMTTTTTIKPNYNAKTGGLAGDDPGGTACPAQAIASTSPYRKHVPLHTLTTYDYNEQYHIIRTLEEINPKSKIQNCYLRPTNVSSASGDRGNEAVSTSAPSSVTRITSSRKTEISRSWL